MKRILLLLFLISVGGFLFFQKGESKPLESVTPLVTQQNETSDVVKPIKPSRLVIPTLGVDVSVESVGLDREEKMDVPKNVNNVAWYRLGTQPGEAGNAVIAGHYDKKDGSPAVFYNLTSMKIGDRIEIYGESGQRLTYEVTGIRTYEVHNFPLVEVFGDHEKSRLNLITCGGEWNGNTYSNRSVVYSELQ